ncbi:MAG: hypothetical protein WCI77_08980 [Candidatus Omnitrophota bacterium]
MKSLKLIIKGHLKHLLFSLLIASLLSCAADTHTTYSRKDIKTIILNLCKNEFNIEVKVWESGETIWIYAPFANVLDEKRQINKDIQANIRRIFLSISRVILSMDKAPKFYAFVFSDTQDIGFDVYYIGFAYDLVKFELNHISLGQMQERQAVLQLLNPQALGDVDGNHINKYDISLGEFVSYLIKQNIEKTFSAPEVKDNFKINELQTNFTNGKLEITFDIMVQKYREGLAYPFDEITAITKRFLKIYDFPADLTEVEIKDNFNKKTRFYSREVLKEGK